MNKNKKRIFFLGTPEIAVPSLEALVDTKTLDQRGDPTLFEYEIVGVGVFPDRKVGRKQVLTPCPVKTKAMELGLSVFEIENKQELVDTCDNLDFDLGMVIAFGMIFPGEILDKFFVNVHFSALPKWRGASPVQSSILAGETKNSVTFQRMVSALDAGDVLMQETFDVEGMTTGEVWENFSHRTAEMMPKFLDRFFAGKIKPEIQDKDKATFCGKFTKQDGEIFPEKESAEEIYRKFLAFSPWPGIYMKTDLGNVKILGCEVLSALSNKTPLPLSPIDKQDLDQRGDPADGFYDLKCANNSVLRIFRAQVPGKKAMDVGEILRGNPGIFGELKFSH